MLYLLVGLINDLIDIFLLLFLSLLDGIIFRDIVFNCQFFKPILDLFNDFCCQWLDFLIIFAAFTLSSLTSFIIFGILVRLNNNDDFVVRGSSLLSSLLS